MSLNANTETALKAWVGVTTWHTDHAEDMRRFYDFVDQYQKDHGFGINENDLQTIIKQNATGPIGDPQIALIRKRVNLAIDILEFLEKTGR